MADVSLGISTNNFVQSGWSGNGVIHVPTGGDTVYAFAINSSSNVQWVKSTNKAATWGSPTTIRGLGRGIAIWFDKWTPGDSGTIIHIVIHGNTDGNLYYYALDTSDDSLSTEVTAADGTNGDTGGLFVEHGTGIVKAVGGNLYASLKTNNGATGTWQLFAGSTDGGATWDDTLQTTGHYDDAGDTLILLPDEDAADTNDIQAAYLDRLNGILTCKKYDQSGDSWSEGSAVVSSITDNTDYIHMSFAPDHTTGKNVGLVWTESFSGTGDCKHITNLSAGTVGTDMLTNATYRGIVGIFVDQNTGDHYGGYLEDQGSGNHRPRYKKWNGTSWSTAADLGQGAGNDDDYKDISLGLSSPGAAACVMVALYADEDDSLVYAGADGAVTITTSGATGTGAVTLDNIQLSATGTMLPSGAGAITLGNLILSGSGTHSPAPGVGAIALNAVVLAATGAQEFPGVGGITLGNIILVGVGDQILSGVGAITLGNIQLAGSGLSFVEGLAALTLGNIVLAGTGSLTPSLWDLSERSPVFDVTARGATIDVTERAPAIDTTERAPTMDTTERGPPAWDTTQRGPV